MRRGWDGSDPSWTCPVAILLERLVHGLEPKVQTKQRPRQCKTYTDMVMGFLLLLGIGRVAILRKQLIGYLAIPLLLVHQIWMLQQVVLLLPMLDCLMEEVSFLYTLLLLFCFIHLHSFDDYHYMIMQLHVASIYSDFLDKVGSSIKPPRIWDIYISLRDSTVEWHEIFDIFKMLWISGISVVLADGCCL